MARHQAFWIGDTTNPEEYQTVPVTKLLGWSIINLYG
jgi:hypothetical protein